MLATVNSGLSARGDLTKLQRELSVRFWATQELPQPLLQSGDPMSFSTLFLQGGYAGSTSAGNKLTLPNASAGERFAVQQDRRNPLPREGAPAPLALVNFEKCGHTCAQLVQ